MTDELLRVQLGMVERYLEGDASLCKSYRNLLIKHGGNSEYCDGQIYGINLALGYLRAITISH